MTLSKTIFAAAGGAVLMVAASAASAATVYQDFNFAVNGGGWSASKTYTSNTADASVNVTAGSFSDSHVVSGSSYTLNSWNGAGLGICAPNRSQASRGCTSQTETSSADSHRVDGNRNNELAVLDFGRAVTIESLTIGHFGNSSWAKGLFDLFSNSGSWALNAAGLNGSSGTYTFTPGSSYTSQIFGIGAHSHWASFKIQSVRVSYNVPDTPSAVPLPAGAVLLLTALGGLGFARKRRS